MGRGYVFHHDQLYKSSSGRKRLPILHDLSPVTTSPSSMLEGALISVVFTFVVMWICKLVGLDKIQKPKRGSKGSDPDPNR